MPDTGSWCFLEAASSMPYRRVMGLPDPEDLFGQVEMYQSGHEAMEYLQRLCEELNAGIGEQLSAPVRCALKQRLERELSYALLTVLTASTHVSASPSPRLRRRALHRSLEYIRAHPRDPLAVRDLVGVSGASLRTLEYAFFERFGISPKRYLKNLRLNSARKEFRRSDPLSTRISYVATRWGFWHMGKFSADYCKLFGELPSETLKRLPGKEQLLD